MHRTYASYPQFCDYFLRLIYSGLEMQIAESVTIVLVQNICVELSIILGRIAPRGYD